MKSLRPLSVVSLFALVLPGVALAQTPTSPDPSALPPVPNIHDLPPPPTSQTGMSGNNVTAPGTTIGAANGTSPSTARTAPGADTPVSAGPGLLDRNRPGSVPVVPPPADPAANATSTVTTALAPARDLNAAPVGNNTAATIDTSRTLNQIEAAPFKARSELATNLAARLDASSEAVKALRARVDAAGDSSQAEFVRALREVEARERRVRTSVRALDAATTESAWNAAQETVLRDYNAYAEAVAKAEAAAQGSVSPGKAK